MVIENTLHTYEGKQVFFGNKFATAAELNKCLKQIDLPSYLRRAQLFLSYHAIYLPRSGRTGPGNLFLACLYDSFANVNIQEEPIVN